MNRPSRATQIGVMAIRVFGATSAMERAERIETSCSALRPPKSRTVRIKCSSLPDRNAPQQILQIIIPPPNPRPERERNVVQRVVDAAADEERGRVLLLRTEDVLAVQPQVRVVVVALGE